MTIALDSRTVARRTPRLGLLAPAGFAALGAGAIHAAAVGAHAEHRQAVWLFVLVAVFQMGWGAVALTHTKPVFAMLGVLANTALVAGWVMAKTGGIGFIDGLESAERAQFADSAAAALAAVAVLAAVVAVVRARSDLIAWSGTPAAAILVGVLTVPGMIAAGSHVHAHDAGHAHSTSESTAAASTASASSGLDASGATAAGTATHVHDAASASSTGATHVHSADGSAAGTGATADATATDGTPSGATATDAASTTVHQHSAGASDPSGTATHDHAPAALPTKVYDPTQPLDFSGVAGVTPEQQAAAENLVAITLLRLPKFADPATAEALGWKSIGDGLLGFEHYINWSLINDNDVLNPDLPESLVYAVDRSTGQRSLASAMFMLPDTVKLTDVPNIGGGLMQWHIHDNLCFTEGDNPLVVGVTNAQGNCPQGLKKFQPAPMIHVWITPNRCGPFAALEGVGAGQIADGQERLCDHVHGDGLGF